MSKVQGPQESGQKNKSQVETPQNKMRHSKSGFLGLAKKHELFQNFWGNPSEAGKLGREIFEARIKILNSELNDRFDRLKQTAKFAYVFGIRFESYENETLEFLVKELATIPKTYPVTLKIEDQIFRSKLLASGLVKFKADGEIEPTKLMQYLEEGAKFSGKIYEDISKVIEKRPPYD